MMWILAAILYLLKSGQKVQLSNGKFKIATQKIQISNGNFKMAAKKSGFQMVNTKWLPKTTS